MDQVCLMGDDLKSVPSHELAYRITNLRQTVRLLVMGDTTEEELPDATLVLERYERELYQRAGCDYDNGRSQPLHVLDSLLAAKQAVKNNGTAP